MIGYADGVAGNSISRRAKALSFTAGLFSTNAEGGFGTPLSVANGNTETVTTRAFARGPAEFLTAPPAGGAVRNSAGPRAKALVVTVSVFPLATERGVPKPPSAFVEKSPAVKDRAFARRLMELPATPSAYPINSCSCVLATPNWGGCCFPPHPLIATWLDLD